MRWPPRLASVLLFLGCRASGDNAPADTTPGPNSADHPRRALIRAVAAARDSNGIASAEASFVKLDVESRFPVDGLPSAQPAERSRPSPLVGGANVGGGMAAALEGSGTGSFQRTAEHSADDAAAVGEAFVNIQGHHRGEVIQMAQSAEAFGEERVTKLAAQGGSSSASVPKIDQFTKEVTELSAKDDEKPVMRPTTVKLLVGVLSMGYEHAYRDVHRETWMQRPGVCRVDMGHDKAPPPEKGCRYYITFVLGVNNKTNKQVATEMEENHDVIQPGLFWPSNHSKFPEKAFHREGDRLLLQDQAYWGEQGFNWHMADKVKKVHWLRFAKDHFKWATHVACQDLDTYPRVDLILKDLEHPDDFMRKDVRLQKPKGWSERHGGIYYGAVCGGGGRGMVQGAFIGLSRSLLECMYSGFLQWNMNAGLGGAGGDMTLYTNVMDSFDPTKGKCPEPWWVGPSGCQGDRFSHPV
eukprot:TRINITY_DN30153_c0_g1_i2.p1 TRINITY_DN30153_c0_g1~~TRINITY_DN30153_c0_g1_i2.p1  ORF type:complete len:468 (-),score=115.31 TRINITY_DN30153_c0_g1_i2:54-1457(-)